MGVQATSQQSPCRSTAHLGHKYLIFINGSAGRRGTRTRS